MSEPERPALPHPSASPRQTKSGRQKRERAIYRQSGGEGLSAWEVEVTPLANTSAWGRGIDALVQKKRGGLFEIRAAYYGTGLPEFGSQPNTRMIPHTHSEDQELALAIARRLEEILRSGGRDIDIVEVAKYVERRRA